MRSNLCTTWAGISSRSGGRTASSGSSTHTVHTSAPTWVLVGGCAGTASSVPSTAGASTVTDVVEVPHLDRRPPRVKARVWDTCERNDRIFVWYHAGGESPQYDVTGYRENGACWTPWRVDTYRVRIGLQDLTENIIDRSHFWTVHDMDPPDDARFEVTFEGPTMVVDQYIKVTAVSERGFEVFARSTTCGPGIVAVEVREGPLDMLTYITQTPVTKRSPKSRFTSRWSLWTTKRRLVHCETERRDHQPPVHSGRTDLGEQDLP